MNKGKLYLIPTFIGEEATENAFPPINLQIINTIDYFIVEDVRTCRRFIKKVCPQKQIDPLQFYILNEHTNALNITNYLTPCKKGENVGLMSEAGMPCIADPGKIVVKLAHDLGLEVVPLVGPSAIMLALIASGLNGQNFSFKGYLPVEKQARIKAIKMLEHRSKTENQTQIFMEAPYRNHQLYADILSTCHPSTLMCIAYDIQLPTQFIRTLKISQWKKQSIDFQKHPAIFLLHSS